MNLVYLLFVSTLLAAIVSWHTEKEERFVSAWSDGQVRISLFEEEPGSKWSHRLIIEKDGGIIRKWGTWENGVFKGPVLGAMPSSFSGIAGLVSIENPRGLLTCHELHGHGIASEKTLYWERQSSSSKTVKRQAQEASSGSLRYPVGLSRPL